MVETFDFRTVHSVDICASPPVVFDYLTNPHSWPEWLSSSHVIEGPARPLREGDTFSEEWGSKRKSTLRWTVTACDRPLSWAAETTTDALGPIIIHYAFEQKGDLTRFTRTAHNPARPQPVNEELARRIDSDAIVALANIKSNLEKMRPSID
jgi:Polyketide cyclase / dehydrase and lipid transport